ncbi:MAG: preprotein translocase subunit YajC [Clostridia bacterium]|nr:preprotein translocase subunit YajC [Clostridia bacterium]
MDATTIVLLVLIVVLVIVYPIMVSARNKKERQKYQEMTNSLKRGDKVLTASGVYGTIVDLHMEDDKKIVTIETGMGNNKGYMAIDAYAIYTVLPDENAQTQETKPAEAPKEDDNIKNIEEAVGTKSSKKKKEEK